MAVIYYRKTPLNGFVGLFVVYSGRKYPFSKIPKTRWLTLYFTIQDGVTGDILQESKKKEKSTAQIWLLIAISRTCCIGRICCKGHFPDIESVGLHFFYVKSSVKLIIRDPTCSASDVWPRRIQKISILRCLSSESLQLSFSP